jgi:hypothetical protein
MLFWSILFLKNVLAPADCELIELVLLVNENIIREKGSRTNSILRCWRAGNNYRNSKIKSASGMKLFFFQV